MLAPVNFPGISQRVIIFQWNYGSVANEPIYLLDGIQVNAQWFSGLNPDEIESVEVIRNLAGTIGYGQSGANSVIQVKTKRLQKNGTSVVYNGYWGFQKPTNVARQMNSAEWAEYIREAYRNTKPPTYNSPTPSLSEDMKIPVLPYNPDVWESLQMGYDSNGIYHPEKIRTTDWTDLVSQTGSIQEQTLTLLHGTKKMRVMTAVNYFSNTGTVKKTGYNRYSARILAESDFTRWLSVGAQIWGSYSEQKLKGNMYLEAFRMNPLAIPYDKSGTLIREPVPNWLNPLLFLNNYEDKTDQNMLTGRLFVSLRPFEGFDVRLTYLPHITKYKQQIDNSYFVVPSETNTSFKGSRNISSWELSISYKKRIQRHLLGGAISRSLIGDKVNYDYQQNQSNGGYQMEHSHINSANNYTLFEFNYLWNNQLSINVLGRYNDEDDLSMTKSFNPAISAAYNFIDTEKRSNLILSHFKLRISFGKNHHLQYQYADIKFNNKYSEWNIGLDHAWFQNRLKGSVDYYVRENHVSMISRNIEYMNLKNTGMEISLSGVPIRSGSWRWVSSLMLSIEKEKIQSPYVVNDPYNPDTYEGYPLHSYWDYKYERIWQDTPEDRALMEKYDPSLRPGDVKIANTNNDDKLDSRDMTVLGSPSPKWYGSLYNSINYRDIEFSFLLYTRQKFMLYNGYFCPSITNSQKIDYWTPTNTGGYYPHPTMFPNFYTDALRYEDASFVRLQYVSLAWSLSQKWISPLRVSQLKIYATVQNPVLLTKFSQSDPEGAATMGSVPGHTTWLLGVRMEL